MKVNEYQKAALKTAKYSPSLKVRYPALGLCGETGEACEKSKKLYRDADWDETKKVPEERAHAAMLELGDVTWYASVLAYDMGFELSDVLFQTHIDQNVERIDYNFVHDLAKENVNLSLACSLSSYYALEGMLSLSTCCIKEVFSYVASIASFFGYTLTDVLAMNIEKLESRERRDKINGEGDYR